ncbi:zinc ribbon domain-containing protein [Rhodoferax saidenbachensis]
MNAMDAKFCHQCGNSTQPARCTQCTATLTAGTRFCGQCGKQANS